MTTLEHRGFGNSLRLHMADARPKRLLERSKPPIWSWRKLLFNAAMYVVGLAGFLCLVVLWGIG